MRWLRVKELHVSIIFLGMFLGLTLADLLTFYPSYLVKNAYINSFQALGLLSFLAVAVYLSLKVHRKRNKQNLFAIINNTENLLFSIDKNYRFLAFNQACEAKYQEVFHQPIKIGQSIWSEKYATKEVEKWKNFFDRGLMGEKFSVDLNFSKMASRPYFISISFNPIFDSENGVKGVGCFLQNITQRLLYEEKIRQQNVKFKEIAYIISHTLRAPLSNILGLVEVLDKENPVNEVNEQIVEYIKFSAKELDNVVRHVVERTVKVNIEDGANEVSNFITA